ncbi:MAG: 2,3-bisphosphoglycerate-independent phosphoglycerate mutase [Alphaproteobacteria bacterium]|nr:2,3-bisphosphoglycerate-independent phosphoglycerate mutase [Alphaproteobacteria bacterium]
MSQKKKPVVLCILDGWGIGDGGEYDAIASADTPNFDSLMAKYPNTTLTTFGLQVGLPEGQMGNSEVGHMNIGAGRIVMQFLPRIDKAFADGDVARDEKLISLAAELKASGKACHIAGLLSDGGVHAHMDHIVKLAQIMVDHGVRVHIHAFTDGRDTPPESGGDYLSRTLTAIKGQDMILLSTICGRYYAMDRDKRWERVQRAYDALVLGKGDQYSKDVFRAIQGSYKGGVTDEFVEPVILHGYKGMEEGDALIFANFRSDRARELCQALLLDEFDGFKREGGKPKLSKAIAMVEYSDELNEVMEILFPPIKHKNILGKVVSKAGLKQVRMAETEKYPHVTFFFNCGREVPYDGEERILVPSPKVATYDLQPEMSAPELSEKLLAAIESDAFDMVIVNFANTDMVGHTGSIAAARQAAETVDLTLGKLEKLVLEKGGVLFVTADHGNADQMFDPKTNGPHTAHTMNPVPFIVVGAGDVSVRPGKLADIAPTMLRFLGLEKPEEMDGESLVG